MNRAEMKEARTIMRRVDDHLRQAHLNLGAFDESIGFVEVVYHETSPLPSLNYVTPRRNTAWVSGNHIQKGMNRLRLKGRTARVRFAAGLYPPVFIRALRDLGLQVEEEMPIMIYRLEQKPRKAPNIPKDTTFTPVSDHRTMAIWWYVWRNAHYDVMTSTAEPILIGRDMRSVFLGHQLNLIMYRHRFPVGVVRITLHEGSAHILAHAIMKEHRTPELETLVREVALDAALHAGSDLVFVSSSDENERHLYRQMGFSDSGSIVSYAEPGDESEEKLLDDALAQPVLVI